MLFKHLLTASILTIGMTSQASITFVEDEDLKNHVETETTETHMDMTIPHDEMDVMVRSKTPRSIIVEYPDNQTLTDEGDNTYRIQKDQVTLPQSSSSHQIPLNDNNLRIERTDPLEITFVMAP